MITLLFWGYTFAHLALLIWGVWLYRRARDLSVLLVIVPLSGLMYDALIIAIGQQIGVGPMLEVLSKGRYLFHAVETPLWIVVAFGYARRAGVHWAWATLGRVAIWSAAFALSVYGYVTRFVGLELVPVEFAGTLRYVEAVSNGPPLGAIVTIVLVGVAGGFVWPRLKWPWMLGGAVVMFLGAAVPTSLVGPVVASGAEVIMALSLLATEQRLQSQGA